MSDTWRAVPGGPRPGGDVLGDVQVGAAYSVRYTHIHHPHAHLDAAFAACYDEKTREYYVGIDIEAQITDARGAEAMAATLERGPTEWCPLAYATQAAADAEARTTAEQWQLRAWSDADFWDGTEAHFPA